MSTLPFDVSRPGNPEPPAVETGPVPGGSAKPWSCMYTKVQIIKILTSIGIKDVEARLPKNGATWHGALPKTDDRTGHSRFTVEWGPKPDRLRLYNLTFE